MDIVPMGPGFAAELRGVTLADVAADDDAYRRTRAAFEEHSVLVFRDQDVTDEAQLAFSRRFGPLEVTNVASGGRRHQPRDPHDHRRERQRGAGRSSAGAAQQGQPALAHRLHFQERAGAGLGAVGDASCRRKAAKPNTCRRGSPSSGSIRRPRNGSQTSSPGTTIRIRAARSRPIWSAPSERAALPPQCWRLVWKNPVNGREALYLASHAYAIEGMEQAAAQKLLAELMEAATAPGLELRAHLAQGRRGDVGQSRDHASRPAVAGARAALHGAHHDLRDRSRRAGKRAAAAAAGGGVILHRDALLRLNRHVVKAKISVSLRDG